MLGRHLWIVAVSALTIGVVPVRAETVTVTIEKMMFSPAEISARPGDTIEWINKDILAHTATVKGDWEVVIPPGKSGRLVLKATTPVDYYCRFHPNMRGRISIPAQ
ncbi:MULTISPECIES: plastocyanin/azurin family copper-binding protein [Rhizobium]|uniref:Secreted protein n=1 Tax=Rhizobium favelukesii TaxID=348824 RepID=W6S9F0_9HYPH|nr:MULTISPECIES: plastocyanin/azurin family copper-binding protein [Rhizobium]MCS0461719.1 cupredoxin domain-containing protein [Rhizobium favelukesii]UFS79224.1 cupredoxin domain-containing protein [Rhizobium sp. T136]CDM62751.1 putative secreted protein [Rhizobium favelukesii]